MVPTFPFSAIVGQETLKRSLLLAVIQPSLGGVLIRGTKGVAKSTTVRALAGLLPPIETVAGCPFQRFPRESLPDWPLPPDAAVISRSVPLVELPLGATEDRVLGSLHLEKALHGQRSFEPGLLAAANRGILYIDEVNLLPDHLVDILLDAAASGVHQVEREGLSLRHPARFVLIGTMNPEEGELRPQLLDRFGLVVDVADLADWKDRAEAVRRRLAFESGPAIFCEQWKPAEQMEAQRIVRAQEILASVTISPGLLQAISERCSAAGVDGLRGDFVSRLQPNGEMLRYSDWHGRWRKGANPSAGRAKGFLQAYGKESILSWAGTIRAASLHQMERGRSGQDDAVLLQMEDLRGSPRRGPGGCLLLFVVDASGSMAARQRMRQTKSAISSLLTQAYERRDQIALLAFRGKGTELILSPTRALRVARGAVERLPVGGTTPLALGLTEARRLTCRQRRRQPRQPIWLILLTDGR